MKRAVILMEGKKIKNSKVYTKIAHAGKQKQMTSGK
jgi:hypothetical protein